MIAAQPSPNPARIPFGGNADRYDWQSIEEWASASLRYRAFTARDPGGMILPVSRRCFRHPPGPGERERNVPRALALQLRNEPGDLQAPIAAENPLNASLSPGQRFKGVD
ncbi:MAG TPA: hypothetical protein VGC09_21060, partial [Rhodopila sp.]